MAVKRKLIECECGEAYLDTPQRYVQGATYGPWKYVSSNLRNTKTANGGDIMMIFWERIISCPKCGKDLMKEKRQYELTPPLNANKPDPIPSASTREIVVMT